MDKNAIAKRMKTVNTLLIISSVCLGIAAIMIILADLFGGKSGGGIPVQGIFYAVLGGLFNIIRVRLNEKYSGKGDRNDDI